MRLPTTRLAAGAVMVVAGALAGPPAARAANHMVQVVDFSFIPDVLDLQAGDSVTWTNAEGTHNVAADDGSFRCANGCDDTGGNGDLANNAWSFTRTFNNPGTIPYYCELHGSPGGFGMSGTINVLGGGGQPGSLQFSPGTATVNEAAGSVGLTVTRTGGDDGAVSVEFATGNGSALAGQDYGATAGALSWPDGDDDPRSFSVPILDDSLDESNETFSASLLNPGGGASVGIPAAATVTIVDDDEGPPAGPCVPDATTLCFFGDRFRLSFDWRFGTGQNGPGQAVPLTDRSGAFYFLNPNNLELLVKMVPGCSLNGHYWVFFAATTNVEFTLTVVDTQAGDLVKSYFNPLNRPAPPVLDTAAFATCP